MPAPTPALSLSNTDDVQCVNRKPALLLGFHPLVRGPLESESSDDIAGIAHGIVRQFGCTRYNLEIELPLKDADSADEPSMRDIRGGVAMVDTLLLIPSDHFSLWSVAESLRLSASEPFVYGTSMELSEDESVSLRLDAKGSNARLMLVYKVGL